MEIKVGDFFLDKRKGHLIKVVGELKKGASQNTWIVYDIVVGDLVPSWRRKNIEWPLIYWHDNRFIKTTESVGMILYGKEKV